MPGVECHAALHGKSGVSKASAESIRQRLLNLARERGEDFDYVLRQYVIQRLLFRLCQSEYKDQYLLKGAQLFWIWNDAFHRPTRDVDLLGFGDNDVKTLVITFQDICSIEVEDGLQFDIEQIQGMDIKEDAMYQGVRITGFAELARARIPFQIDIGFGDVVSPEPVNVVMPVFLDLAAPKLRAYPVYTVLAEKFQAMVYLGMANSRMKDFYDVWFLASSMELDGRMLVEAVNATFARRQTAISNTPLLIFDETFTSDKDKTTQWNAFVKKNALSDVLNFAEVMEKLEIFLNPVYLSIVKEQDFSLMWSAPDWQWKES
jgi:predicted nucleotidyltransferase component of viral defense system